MAELTIRLVVDPDTRKKTVIIAYDSDADALPMEHEDEHRRLVDQLIEGGALTAAEVGAIVIERERGQDAAKDLPRGEVSATPEGIARKR